MLTADSKDLRIGGLGMAKIAVIMKIFPKDIEVNLDELVNKIKASLPEIYELKDYRKEPIAFGLQALIVSIVMPENVEGGTEELEKTISNIPEVGEVSVEYVSRIS